VHISISRPTHGTHVWEAVLHAYGCQLLRCGCCLGQWVTGHEHRLFDHEINPNTMSERLLSKRRYSQSRGRYTSTEHTESAPEKIRPVQYAVLFPRVILFIAFATLLLCVYIC